MLLVITVGVGSPDVCVKLCFCTVMLPLEAAAKPCICPNTQSVAAPIPRLGSVWLDSARRAGSKFPVVLAEPTLAEAALAGAITETTGAAATAVTADAERNVRRLGPFEPDT